MVASVLAFGAMLLGHMTTAEAYNDTQSRWSEVTKSKKTVDQAEDLMGKNGLMAAIEANGGGYTNELKAMAIHEADGRLGAVNEGSLAYCAFQIYHTNIPAFASRKGMSEKAYIQALLTDPATCAEAGGWVLSDMISRHGYDKGICYYGGQITEYKETGSCSMLREIKIIIGLIDGTLKQEVVTDKDSPDYGNVIIKDNSGEIVTTLNCQDRSKKLALALRKANDAYMTTAFEAGERESVSLTERDSGRAGIKYEGVPEDDWRYEKGTPLKEVRGKIADTYCLKVYFDYFNFLRGLMSTGQLIEAAIMAVVEQILDYACEYATEVATQFIDSTLNKFCLSIPTLHVGLNFSHGSATSCSGFSLADVLAVGYGQIDAEDFENGVSWPSDGGMPPVAGMPTGRPDVPHLLLDLRRQ